VADGLAKSAPVPPTVDPRVAPDIAWVAQIGAVTSEEKSPPRPFYLRAPDAQPQNAAQLPRR
ncbi:MAG: tRNA (adenosine(37)-N6)-threonylcarbamoyltransferase complex dimerization subunit type 1 TsaB, partial [Xanthobacteraceae bacterium]